VKQTLLAPLTMIMTVCGGDPQLNVTKQCGWHSGNTVGLCLGGAMFESWLVGTKAILAGFSWFCSVPPEKCHN
jgi:hypothetical protein